MTLDTPLWCARRTSDGVHDDTLGHPSPILPMRENSNRELTRMRRNKQHCRDNGSVSSTNNDTKEVTQSLAVKDKHESTEDK